MAKVNLVNKRVNMKLDEIIKFQLMTHCYIHKINLNDSDLECLVLLSILGNCDLTEFCTRVSQKNIFKATQTVRNCIVKLEKYDLIERLGTGKYKKTINLNPAIKAQVSGNIVLDYKIVHIDTTQS